MIFPENCLRGIKKEKNITPEGKVVAEVFLPDERTAKDRVDGGSETSINWETDNDALPFTLSQYPSGVVRLQRAGIDHVATRPGLNMPITYEFTPREDNDYHGDIVYSKGLSMRIKRVIAASLALESSPPIRQ